MAGGKLSPRQKMINMMYLVLTALLALNVTKEVINAFVTINESVVLSKENLDKKNQNTYAAFAQKMTDEAAKYKDVNDKANQIRKSADEINKFIESTKDNLIRTSEGLKPGEKTPTLPEMDNKEDYDNPTRIMIGKDDHSGKGAVASDLKKKLEDYKKLIVANLPNTVSKADYEKRLNALINTADPAKAEDGKRTWEMMSFYHNPVVATVALLSKFQSDVRNAESQVTEDLLNSVGKFDFHPDQLSPKVIANSTVVTNGSNYEADIFLAATSSTLTPDVFSGATYDSTAKTCKGCDDAAKLPTAGGYAKFTQASSGEGERKWGGVIRVKKGDGSMDYYPFNASYIAQKPSSVVAAEKMNVLYIGIDNPIAVSVPGVSNDKVKLSISGGGGALKGNPAGGAGHYFANVATVGPCTLSVAAEIGGRQQQMGTFAYRVKKVPPPVATISNKYETGPIDKNILKAGAVIPLLKDFPFELFYVTTEFKMIKLSKSAGLIEYEAKGSRLTPEMAAAIEKSRPGEKILFENIKARMDKSTAATNPAIPLSPMSFTIQ